MAKEVKTPRKKANGYKFPKALPKGEILHDTRKKQWQLGPSIGKGGFGEVYSAAEACVKKSDFPYVIKIVSFFNFAFLHLKKINLYLIKYLHQYI